MFKTKFGLTYWQVIKIIFYQHIGINIGRCLCGGKIVTIHHVYGYDNVGWETHCQRCEQIYDED
jgi:hypothetical protein